VHNDTEVSVIASHPKGGSLTVTWTIERARKAGLTANPTWQKHPAAMLTARAVAQAVRAVYPACLSGVIVEDEAIEIAAESETLPLPQPTVPRRKLNGSNGSKAIEVISIPAIAQEDPQNTQEASAMANGAETEQGPLQAPGEASIPAPLSILPAPGFTHPLDGAFCHLDQQKLTDALVKRSLIKDGETYQSCGPEQTKRILADLPRFLSITGFDGDSIAC